VNLFQNLVSIDYKFLTHMFLSKTMITSD